MKPAERFRNFQKYSPIEPFEVLSKRLGRKIEDIVKLDANENPYGPAQAVKQSLANLNNINIYPDPESRALRAKLSEFTGVDQNLLLAGAGADELIDLILRVMLEPGDVVINCPPTFGMYPFDTRLNNGVVFEVTRNNDFSINTKKIREAITENSAKILFLTSPNNPDGSLILDEDLRQILELPVLVVLDEAYIEFTADTLTDWRKKSHIQWVSSFENLVVLRTFSKWAGLAGLRVGYGAFPSWLLPSMWAAKQPYNVNVAANQAAIESLKSLDFLTNNVRKIRQDQRKLFRMLSTIPFIEPVPSEANFILCRVNNFSASYLKNFLLEKGIMVRYYETPLLENYIRISVGKPDDHMRLMKALEELQ
ncbi:MAG: histidinol-phosphate transaminase [Chloroflexi bacterium HGW-Chloroflexi-3]|nr:MAG: histidinol-phosphate transaminase [Chloroflexi bacterium HGW-Chloroflexi-3]